MEARGSAGLAFLSGIQRLMAHFLLVPSDVPCPPVGFSLLEKFRCPNCGREVFIASTAHEQQCEPKEIIQARNAVSLNCPVHGLPACVDVPSEEKHLGR